VASLNAKNRLVKPFVPNSKLIFTLPLGGKIRRGTVILAGNVNVTAGTTSGTAYGEGGPVNLIQRVIVTATPAGGSRYPGGKIVDVGPRSLLRHAITQRSGKFIADLGGSALSAGAVANSAVYLPIPLYFADSAQKNTLATALNTDPGVYASVQVEVDTGSLASCFTGNDRTVDYSGLTVQWVDDRVAVAGDTAVLYQESHSMLIAATNKRALDEAMPQDGSFMSWQILGEQSAQKTLSDALLNRVVVSGPTLDFDKYALDLREADFADEWYDPSLTATGCYFIDFTDGAVQANTVPAGSLQLYFDVNNVSGANLDDLDIFTRRIFQPAPASSSN
jgi:hypothetical protein